ncbi:MAG: SCP2 sterol-binding domain-containing protein [Solirubrobacterales bacterium]
MTSQDDSAELSFAEGADPQQVARMVHELSDQRLAELLVDEVREAALGEIFRRFPDYVDPERIGDSEGLVEWVIADDGTSDRFLVRFEDGGCRVGGEPAGEPRVTLELGAVAFVKLVTGNANPATMYLSGVLGLRGDVLFAIEMGGFLRIPGAEGETSADGALDPSGVDATDIALAVRGVDDSVLRERMRGEVRELILDEVIRRFPEYLDGSKATGVDSVIGWKITGREDGEPDRFRVVVRDGVVRAGREIDEEPKLTIKLDGVDFLKLVTGNLNPVMAFMSGKLKLNGDVAFAARLPGIFRIPSAEQAG